MNLKLFPVFLFWGLFIAQCTQNPAVEKSNPTNKEVQVKSKTIPALELGASQMDKYIQLLNW